MPDEISVRGPARGLLAVGTGGFGLDGWAPRLNQHVACWRLPVDPKTAAHARTLTRNALHRWRIPASEDRDDIVLMVDELVTNAVLHGDGPVGLRLSIDGPKVRCEVTDANPLVPQPCDPAADAEAGRGLLLVTAIAAEFGAMPGGYGKIVWFTHVLAAERPNDLPYPPYGPSGT
ncbi:MAG TPA: ATP-binding protein [Streptosporangiaceae bacterium]|jgi:anti-sigma regulatory factor (Ser/Thr protein kinase)